MSTEKPAPRPIAKLPEAVVNRIAAGEIIQRPSNALKELIENSLDAGSTSIRVSVKEGGIKLLQIQDNGSGIRKDDLPILCERFTTSKIKDFDDLSTLGTYGFRGEALASISHVAHLTVTTKTKSDACAWKAAYSDGQLIPVKSGSTVSTPVPTAGNDGTTIVVEDLFFNTPQRLKSLRSASDEYSRIVGVVLAYSIHNSGIAMSCKRQNAGSTADVNTQVGSSVLDNIGLSYGESTKKELVHVEAESEEQGVKVNAWCSGPNFQAKRGFFLFFINNRFVDCSPLKRALEGFYGTLLAKGTHPFVYLSLSIHPTKIDVNVHPTKKEVGFEDQDEIVELICLSLAKALEEQGASRSYKVQTLLPGSSAARPPSSSANRPSSSSSNANAEASTSQKPIVTTSSSSSTRKTSKTAPQKLVRTDANSQTLDSMFPVLGSSSSSTISSSASKGKGKQRHPTILDEGGEEIEEEEEGQPARKKIRSDHENPGFAKAVAEEQARQMKMARVRISQSECSLTSVKGLRNRIIEERNEELDQLFKNHIFVGIADLQTGRSLIQHQTKLYLVKHNVVAEQLFYQLTLRQFGRFNRIKMKPPISLKKLIRLGIEKDYPRDGSMKLSVNQIVTKIYNRLFDVKEMIDEYFSIEINDEGELVSLPVILPGHAPSLEKLPLFLLRIGIYVDWEQESECFESLATELAFFYSPTPFLSPHSPPSRSQSSQDSEDSEEANQKRKEVETKEVNLIKNVLYPAFKTYLVPSDQLITGKKKKKSSHDGDDEEQAMEVKVLGEKDAIVLITRLESLYKVFERC
ncbi:mismatch repair ATPase MLH1 [Sporobolomyces salmoneus]|uniref:mismatch repair ATPase MLH1 n=1 Tax=Sporobolomyces salmoneus TaxID=183962 RepID=UPI003171DCBA